ncbi:MAG: hypothetical protein C6P35_14080 [Cohnella sp.]|uniref:hypothetical protein n=1 Tax=Cohnella sp. TaxID=1883426 RepID=UPI000E39D913|nr:hypothetical protein [Cohnella sp.]REK63634.1 MAG: hypothetical protein C6P35_14080 [Cohnella sp.]
MEQDNRPDLNINGVGSAAGGRYRQLTIHGVGKLAGATVSDSFMVNGQVKTDGDVRTGRLHCNGHMVVGGGLSSKEARIDGMVRVRGGMNGERIYVNGGLHVRGDCEAETFQSNGWFDVEGLLNAGEVEIRIQGKCAAREIGGERIRILRGGAGGFKRLWQRIVPKLAIRLTADTIEGDDIELENTTAAVVRGNRVKIGQGCAIGRVEYRSELLAHPQAKIEQRVQG